MLLMSVIYLPLTSFFSHSFWLTSLITSPGLSYLTYLFPSHCLPIPLCLLRQPDEPTATGATTTRAGGSAGSTRGTATEREGTTEENGATTTHTSEPKKKKNPRPFLFLLCCQLRFACLPVVPSSHPLSPNTTSHLATQNSPPKPTLCTALPCPALHSTPWLPESACIIVNSEACQSAARCRRDDNRSLSTLLTFLFSVFLSRLNSHLSSNSTQLLSLRAQRWPETWGYADLFLKGKKKKEKYLWDPHRTFFGGKQFSTNYK